MGAVGLPADLRRLHVARRLADLLGRRNVLLAGTGLVAVGSAVGGFSDSAGLFVAARLVQGAGAALMLPAALSTLTTNFTANADRTKALGVWGAIAGLSSAVGILAGGLLVQGPGSRRKLKPRSLLPAVTTPSRSARTATAAR